MISTNKTNGKSKCAICLTERTFIHEIEDKCDLGSELEVYLKFFTDNVLLLCYNTNMLTYRVKCKFKLKDF